MLDYDMYHFCNTKNINKISRCIKHLVDNLGALGESGRWRNKTDDRLEMISGRDKKKI